MTEPNPPWYRRPLLPPWFPGWLAAALLVGAGFALAFGLALGDQNPWVTALVAGGVGFGLAVVVLSMTPPRDQAGRPNLIAPPPAVRGPVLTAVVAFFPLSWVLDRQVRLPKGGGPLFSGTPAVAAGLLGLTAIASLLAAGLVIERRQSGRPRPAVAVSLGVVIVALGVALFSLATHPG